MSKDYWTLTREIAERVGNQEVIEQCDEHQKAINAKVDKIANQRELLKNL